MLMQVDMFCDRTYNLLCNLDAVQFLCSATKISSSCKIDGGALVEYIKDWKKLVVCGMCCAYTWQNNYIKSKP
jgi:hypothetical protein